MPKRAWSKIPYGVSEGTLREFRQRGKRFELIRERAGILRIQIASMKKRGLLSVWTVKEGSDRIFLADDPAQLTAFKQWLEAC